MFMNFTLHDEQHEFYSLFSCIDDIQDENGSPRFSDACTGPDMYI